MTKTLQMVFLNEAGKNVTISIPDVRDDITSEDIKTLMQLIISKNVFDSTGGNFVSVMSADVVTRDVQEMTVRQ